MTQAAKAEAVPEPRPPHTPAGDALSEALQDTYVSREPDMAQRQLAQVWRALRSRGHTVATFADLGETGTEHWNVPCGHGMAAHNDSGCVDCECTTPGLHSRAEARTVTAVPLDVERLAIDTAARLEGEVSQLRTQLARCSEENERLAGSAVTAVPLDPLLLGRAVGPAFAAAADAIDGDGDITPDETARAIGTAIAAEYDALAGSGVTAVPLDAAYTCGCDDHACPERHPARAALTSQVKPDPREDQS